MTELESKVFTYLSAPVSDVGYELVDVTFKKEYGTPTLTVYIWKKGGISLDDCEKVHGVVNTLMDELNPTGDDPYNLNVSSPGLDRPIVTTRDYERNLDEEICVNLKTPFQGKKKLEGTLISVDDSDISLEIKNNTKITIKRETVASAKPVIRF